MEPIIRAAAVAKTTRQLRRPMEQQSALTNQAQTPAATAARPNLRPTGAAPTPSPQPIVHDTEQSSDQESDLIRLEQEFAQRQSAQELLIRQQREVELAKARAAAESQGYADGLAEGERAAQQLAAEQTARLASVLGQLHQARLAVVSGAEDIMVDIAYRALCRIMGENVGQRATVISMVNHVLSQFREHEPLVVRLHPQDLALVQQALQELAINTEQTQLRADPSLKMGGCLVESMVGTLDARLETQLSRLRDALLLARHSDDYAGEGL